MKNPMLLVSIILVSFVINAQTLNSEISEDGDKPYLLGKIDKNGLTSENYNTWFSENYNNYEVDETAIIPLTSELKNCNITLFMGTWCGDSKQEVPKFFKILEACNFPMKQLNVVALSNKPNLYKQSPQHEEAGLNIHRVPTFIFYKNGIEINRIVEHPVETFEQDMLNILTTNSYQSNYQLVAEINSILENSGIKGLKKQNKQLIKSYKGKVESYSGLNTYGVILSKNKKTDEAIAVLRINNKLFPNNPRTYMSLANTLAFYGFSKKATKVFKKAIKRFPENNELVENLEKLKAN